MKQHLLLPAIGLALAAGGAGAEPSCIDEGYDSLTGRSKRAIAQPELGIVPRVDPERAERRWLDDPSRPPLATSR